MSTGNWPSYETSSPTGKTGGGGSWVPGAVGGLFSSLISARQQKKEREHRTQTEADRRKYDKERWDEYNRYNHPLAQMERLRAAGLNPNLIYGSSPGSAVGNAGQIASAKAPELNYTNWAEPGIQQYQNIKVNQAQSNNLNSLSTLNDVKTLTELQTKRLRGTEADLAKGNLQSSMEIRKMEAKISYQKFLQSELETIAVKANLKPRIAKFAAEAMTARIQQDTAGYLKNQAALKSYLTEKGIPPDSYKWLQIMALMPSLLGKVEFDHEGFKKYKQEQHF